MGSSPTPGAANAQVEAGIDPALARPVEICPAVAPRRFRDRRGEAASGLVLAPHELLVPITTSGGWRHPETREFGELLIDLEEDNAAREVVFGLLAVMERK